MTETDPWKVLLIDDEGGIRRVMRITLEDAGHAVAEAADGASGLAACAAFMPQIVITDIRMPGMDGLEVLEAVKRSDPDIEVIVVTAFGEMDLAIRALRLDASDFITKPVHDDVLLVAIERAKERYTTRKRIKDYTRYLEDGWTETTQELLETVAFQRNLIESSMDGIMGADPDGRIMTFNRSLEHMLGFQKGDVLHRRQMDAFFPPGVAAEFHRAVASEAYGGRHRLNLYETTLTDAAGKQVPVQVSATVLYEQEEESGIVLFIRDLRELRRLEREMADQANILHQDKMMSLGRLAASVVHEINNPLAGILNYLRLMLRIGRRGPLSADDQTRFVDYLELVEAETERCSRIISNLLTFSRKTPPAKGDVPLAEVVERCLILSQHKLELSHIRLASHVAPNLPVVRGDANQIQQCVINLIFNAIDAMPDGGDLTVSTDADRSRRAVVVAVRDSGIGITEEQQRHIFEPFFTTKQEGYGVGLGLSTVYGIMEDHGGGVEVSSTPGRGTTFRLVFPVAEPADAKK